MPVGKPNSASDVRVFSRLKAFADAATTNKIQSAARPVKIQIAVGTTAKSYSREEPQAEGAIRLGALS